jgi:hypothetical protein
MCNLFTILRARFNSFIINLFTFFNGRLFTTARPNRTPHFRASSSSSSSSPSSPPAAEEDEEEDDDDDETPPNGESTASDSAAAAAAAEACLFDLAPSPLEQPRQPQCAHSIS